MCCISIYFQTVSSSVLNTTFDVEESPPDKEPQPEVKEPNVKVTGKPPLKLRKQKSDMGRSVLGAINFIDNSVRSSDEFEQSMRKTQSSSNLKRSSSSNKGEKINRSSSNLRKTSSSSGLKKRASSNSDLQQLGNSDDSVSTEGLAKKRKLYNARESFFDDIYANAESKSWLVNSNVWLEALFLMWGQKYCIYPKYLDRQAWANSLELGSLVQSLVSDSGSRVLILNPSSTI